jgi:hypothetical protein
LIDDLERGGDLRRAAEHEGDQLFLGERHADQPADRAVGGRAAVEADVEAVGGDVAQRVALLVERQRDQLAAGDLDLAREATWLLGQEHQVASRRAADADLGRGDLQRVDPRGDDGEQLRGRGGLTGGVRRLDAADAAGRDRGDQGQPGDEGEDAMRSHVGQT